MLYFRRSKRENACEDFYAHMCPADFLVEQTVMSKNQELFIGLVANISSPLLVKFKNADQFDITQLRELCTGSDYGRNLTWSLVSNPSWNKTITCQEMVSVAVRDWETYNDMGTRINNYLTNLEFGTHAEAQDLNKRTRELTTHLLQVSRRDFLVGSRTLYGRCIGFLAELDTPWMRFRNGTDAYLRFLDKTFEYSPLSLAEIATGVSFFEKVFEEADKCQKRLNATSPKLYCILAAFRTAKASTMGEKLLLKLDSDHNYNAYNDEDYIYISRPPQLFSALGNVARRYGSLGVLVGHEIMHTFFQTEHDSDTPDQLQNYWTNSSDCVFDQYQATCQEYFGEKCRSGKDTLEEDGSDLAGMRLAYRSYKQTLSFNNLDDYPTPSQDKMFFYALATSLCIPDANTGKPNKPFDMHSNVKVRVNAFLAQMPEWKEAFSCPDNSRMLKNKAKQCHIFGEGSPLTKSFPKPEVLRLSSKLAGFE